MCRRRMEKTMDETNQSPFNAPDLFDGQITAKFVHTFYLI